MDADRRTIHLRGLAQLALVDRALDALDELWSQAAHVGAEDRVAFGLALSEVATNMVQHSDGPFTVTLTLDIDLGSEDITATLVDTARPAAIYWDGVSMPDVDSEGGRGLALATAVLDELRHTSDADGNTWVLRRRFRDAQTPR